jgi:hypothetical protein
MNGSIIRALVALLLAAIFWMQARGARGQPRRKRAFELLAAACLVFAALLGSTAAGVAFAVLSSGLLVVAIALIVAAVLSLLASFRAGEMRGQIDRVAQAAKEYREQAERRQKP